MSYGEYFQQGNLWGTVYSCWLLKLAKTKLSHHKHQLLVESFANTRPALSKNVNTLPVSVLFCLCFQRPEKSNNAAAEYM